MYCQILVAPEFHEFQDILWREYPHDKIVEYQLNTVTYGVNCAPFLALCSAVHCRQRLRTVFAGSRRLESPNICQ